MEDWGPRSPANPIPFPRRGRGLPPGGQQGAPRQHVNRQQVRSLAPFGTLSHAPLPQGPIRLAVGPRTCRPPPLLHPLGPLLRFHARHLEINDPACQAPGTLGPQCPLGSKLAHWLSPSTGLCDAAIFACLAVAFPRVTLAVCPLLGWPSDNTRSSPELSVRTCSVCWVSG